MASKLVAQGKKDPEGNTYPIDKLQMAATKGLIAYPKANINGLLDENLSVIAL